MLLDRWATAGCGVGRATGTSAADAGMQVRDWYERWVCCAGTSATGAAKLLVAIGLLLVVKVLRVVLMAQPARGAIELDSHAPPLHMQYSSRV